MKAPDKSIFTRTNIGLYSGISNRTPHVPWWTECKIFDSWHVGNGRTAQRHRLEHIFTQTSISLHVRTISRAAHILRWTEQEMSSWNGGGPEQMKGVRLDCVLDRKVLLRISCTEKTRECCFWRGARPGVGPYLEWEPQDWGTFSLVKTLDCIPAQEGGLGISCDEQYLTCS